MSSLTKSTPPSVLIVDDEPLVRELFRLALQSVGFETFEAGDGEQALAFLRRRSFSLLLLDLQMPLVNGKTVLTSVRQMFLHEKMSIAVITADMLRATDEVHAIADRVMYKPVDMREFIEFARHLMGVHGTPPGGTSMLVVGDGVNTPLTNPSVPVHPNVPLPPPNPAGSDPIGGGAASPNHFGTIHNLGRDGLGSSVGA